MEIAIPIIFIVSCAASHFCGYLQGRADGAEAAHKFFTKCLDEVTGRRE